MYVTHHYMDVMPETARKRTLEEADDAIHGITSFGEHRNKRLQCLPLRSSPRSSEQWPHYSSITPLGPHAQEGIPRSQFDRGATESAAQLEQLDSEMDMTDSIGASQPADLGRRRGLAPPDSHSSETGRMPTPIQPSFAAQVRGQRCEWAGPGPTVSAVNGIVNMGHQSTSVSDNESVPRIIACDADWQALHNNRRLPSPISEVDDSLPDGMRGPSDMAFDGDDVICEHVRDGSISPRDVQHDMEHPNAMMDVETPPASQAADGDADGDSPSPNRRGHMRSKHTINSWTWQPGMKRSFSIGYRADCEKCRLKVPGHFNHIIVS